MVRLERGEECMESLASFAGDQEISGAEVSGIGAFLDATVGAYQLEEQDYHRIPVAAETEVLSFLGNLSLTGAGPRVHVHVTLSYRDGTAVGGHLFEATVGATLELFVREAGAELRRADDAQIGLPLLDL
jgi:predicted DNA-binding protein with PD1-like motif